LLVVWARDIQVAAADIINSLIINQKSAVRVLDCAVGRQDSVVWLDDRRGNAWSRIDGEFELALLSVVGRQAFEQESTEARSSTSSEGMED
jgi:hypothetical protein